MFRILFRLYLVTIVSFSAAIYLVPDLVIKVFHERFLTYNLDYSRGLQTLMVKQFKAVPVDRCRFAAHLRLLRDKDRRRYRPDW